MSFLAASAHAWDEVHHHTAAESLSRAATDIIMDNWLRH